MTGKIYHVVFREASKKHRGTPCRAGGEKSAARARSSSTCHQMGMNHSINSGESAEINGDEMRGEWPKYDIFLLYAGIKKGDDTDDKMEARILEVIDEASVDAVVCLALDHVYSLNPKAS